MPYLPHPPGRRLAAAGASSKESFRMRQLLALTFLLPIAGCVTEPTISGYTPVNTSLSSLMSNPADAAATRPAPFTHPAARPTTTERLAQEHKIDVQAILDKDTGPAAPPEPSHAEIPTPTNPNEQPQANAQETTAEIVPEQPASPIPNPASMEPEVPQAPPKTLQERIDDASVLLTDLLRQDSAATDAPFKSALALAAMEAVRPGSAPKVITPDSVDGGPLTDEQRDLVNAFRDLVAGMAAAVNERPGDLTDRAAELGSSFTRARPMRIGAALAAKVTGYGQYIPLGVNKLQQGKPARAVVYTEVKRFTQRPIKDGDSSRLSEVAQSGDNWAVELSQELQLIHDADGVKAWQRPEQVVIETSRSFRTDFYLVQNITFPQTLSIGAYKLKIIVRDKSSGQEDEAIIPIQVVADPSLVIESSKGLSD